MRISEGTSKMKSISVKLLTGFFLMIVLIGVIEAQTSTSSNELTVEENKLIHEDIKEIYNEYRFVLKDEDGWPVSFNDDLIHRYNIQAATSIVNIYFEAIRGKLLVPKFNSKSDETDFPEYLFMNYVQVKDELPENLVFPPKIVINKNKEEIRMKKAQKMLCDNINERIEFWSKILKSSNENWTNYLTKAQNIYNQQDRRQWYKNWYVSDYKETFIFKPTPDDFRRYIFDNFTVPPNGYGTDEANCLLNWKENSGLQEFLDSEDCQKRPWYVADRFFMFMNLERFQGCKEYRDLCKFFPANRNELGWNRELLKNSKYTENIKIAVRNWLILKFGYRKDSPELQDRDLPQLLSLLRENFEAVRPYHRFLYDQIQDEEVRKFLNYFIN